MIFSNITAFGDSLRPAWPVIRTENIYDFTQANGSRANYVWLVDKHARLESDFPMSWLPHEDQENCCHVFKQISQQTGYEMKPVAILVPNVPIRRRAMIEHKRPAQIERNTYSIYVKIERSTESRERCKEFATRWSGVHPLMTNTQAAMNKSVLRTLHSKYAWIVEQDQEFEDDWDFNFSPDRMNAIYLKPKIFVMPNGVKLYPKEYFLAEDSKFEEIKVDPQ